MSSNEITIRQATSNDAPACGKICYNAFSAINAAHNFPCDFPNPEYADRLIHGMFNAPGFYCVVAESNGQILGSNCLDERAIIHGVGPITVDPDAQNRGVGRLPDAGCHRPLAAAQRRRNPPRPGRLQQPLALAVRFSRLRHP